MSAIRCTDHKGYEYDSIDHFREDGVAHPNLSTRGWCRYGYIEAKYICTTADGQAWYKTKCSLCGRKDILSAQDIVETTKMKKTKHTQDECLMRHKQH